MGLEFPFNLVNHKFLLHKLHYYGVRGLSVMWFQNYFANRQQSALLGNEISPQGSILSPLLRFVMFINDFHLCLKHSSVSMYADDTVIYFTGTNVGIMKGNLQEGLLYTSNFGRVQCNSNNR
jgi:hypothetical protein